MTRFLYSILFVSVALGGATAATFAQVPTRTGSAQTPTQTGVDSTKIYAIDRVVTIGHRIDKETIPAQVLSGDELKRLNTVSVADAIRYFSGVQIKDYGGIGGLKTVNIRSMGSQHVGVFYDGVQIGNAQNGTVDLGRFSMDNMEVISLYNGQKSDIFQSAKDFASAGAIYLQTRRPVFSPGRKHNTKLSLKGGSFGTINPSALWEARISQKVDAQLSAEYMYTTGRYKFSYRKQNGYDTTEVRRNGEVRALRIEGGLFGRLRKGDWRAKVYFHDSGRGYPGAVVAGTPGKFANEDRQWDTNVFVQGSLRQTFGRYALMVNAKYAHDKLRYLQDVYDGKTAETTDNRYRQHELYFSVANSLAITDRWRVSLSADALTNTLDAELGIAQEGFVRPRRLTALVAAATDFEWRSLRLQASELYTFVRNDARLGNVTLGEYHEWTPTAMATWRPLRRIDLDIRAFYKSIFRVPTLSDIYYTFTGTGYSRLDPEYTRQYNLGAVWTHDFARGNGRGRFRRIEIQIDGYFNRVDDKIVAMPTNNQFRWTMINLGYVEIRGLDAAVQTGLRFGAVDIDARLSYTYQKAQDFSPESRPRPGAPSTVESYFGHQIPYIPWHSGSAVVGATFDQWSLNFSFIYTGERYESHANTPVNYALPWYTSDMSISRTVALPRSQLRLTAEVNNIFNQQYEVVQCYPMPGTNFKIKIDWTL
jgi:outer membrane cobalamin receptor